MNTPSPARAYRAACPQCGAPVAFASAASTSAVCSYCRSTLARDGDTLRRLGTSAELFDDHSPLQLGTQGRRQGLGFALVGRLQIRWSDGVWSEWHALFENGRSAWLSEDNGAYVFAFDAPVPADAPDLATLKAGQRVLADGRAWDVASVLQVGLQAAEGELPSPPPLQGRWTVADLRNGAGEVATLEARPAAPPSWSVGRSVTLTELSLTGLREVAEKTLRARSFSCPSCGAALEPRLAGTRSLSCGQCSAVVDVSQGEGAELAHFRQQADLAQAAEPQIPLGRSGRLALKPSPPVDWQVVGYQERCDIPQAAEDDTTFWREYLLYSPLQGFAFLVDSEEGWSLVRPLTGAPQVKGDVAVWQGVSYRRRWQYGARVTWVVGEFYWQVRQGERALVTDYAGSGSAQEARLSREQTGQEVTWSAGHTLRADEVAKAFGLDTGRAAALRRDPAPTSQVLKSGGSHGWWILVAIIVLIVLLAQCSDDGCEDVRRTFGADSLEARQCASRAATGGSGRIGGGSYGGWSSGGGHK